VRLQPENAASHYYLAEALLKAPGRASEAVAQLEETLRLQPGNEPARQLLDRTLAAQH
jgi:cytochrome c-type biogenesis protein CcmH/NrfG